jgi:glycerol-3-phosphate acyltransferase PlsY
VLWTALLALASYLIGAIPFGYLLVRMLRGVDVRTVGSKTLGATNVARYLGAKWFAVVFVFDFGKGFVPAFVLGGLAHQHFAAPPEIGILYGLLAMCGHIWPVYLGFKGGKGVATAAGTVTGIAPTETGIAAIVFLILLLAFRYVSLGSICAAISLPISYFALRGPDGFDLTLLVLVAMCVLVVFKHRTNISRLLAGTENRVGRRKTGPVPATDAPPEEP